MKRFKLVWFLKNGKIKESESHHLRPYVEIMNAYPAMDMALIDCANKPYVVRCNISERHVVKFRDYMQKNNVSYA